ncbi:MAG: hypothetical protein H6716_24045 [Polyangiaceae bacterium]|nr:hypothetical protein [Polyangiaceae bacterium]
MAYETPTHRFEVQFTDDDYEALRDLALADDIRALAIRAAEGLGSPSRWHARFRSARQLRLASRESEARDLLAEQVDDVLMRSDYACTTPGGALEAMELARELADAGDLHLAALAATVACDDVTHTDQLFFRFVIDDLGKAAWPSEEFAWPPRWRTVALDRDRSACRADDFWFERVESAFEDMSNARSLGGGDPSLSAASRFGDPMTRLLWSMRWKPGPARDKVVRNAIVCLLSGIIETDTSGGGDGEFKRSADFADTRSVYSAAVWFHRARFDPAVIREAVSVSASDRDAAPSAVLEGLALLSVLDGMPPESLREPLAASGLEPYAAWLFTGTELSFAQAQEVTTAPSFLALASAERCRALTKTMCRDVTPERGRLEALVIAALATLVREGGQPLTNIVPLPAW